MTFRLEKFKDGSSAAVSDGCMETVVENTCCRGGIGARTRKEFAADRKLGFAWFITSPFMTTGDRERIILVARGTRGGC